VPGCANFYLVIAGDDCWTIANANSIALADFYTWNPVVGSECQSLQPSYYVCVRRTTYTASPTSSQSSLSSQLPTPIVTSRPTSSAPTTARPSPAGLTQTGTPPTCNKWISQKDGVYCYDMAAAAGITLVTLYGLNPALNGDCTGLWPGYTYCIGTG
jgi:hypothetical protein